MIHSNLHEGHVRGGNGVKLFFRAQSATVDRPCLLFIHGWSQSHYVWKKQFNSELCQEHDLVAFDLRGHGYSEAPVGNRHYTDGKLYAQDLRALIDHIGKERTVLVGWSSGSLVIGDYLRHYGAEGIEGIIFVAGLFALGTPKQIEMSGTGPSTYMVDTMANDFETQYRAMTRCTSDMVVQADSDEIQLMLAQSMMTNPEVRSSTMNRVVDNTDVLTEFTKSAMLINGRHDPFVTIEMGSYLQRLLSNSALSIYETSAHMPFWEEPDRFNRELHRFISTVFQPNR